MADDSITPPGIDKAALQILETSPDFYALIDLSYRYVYVNQAFIDRYGVPREKLIGSTPEVVVGSTLYKGKTKPAITTAMSGEMVHIEVEIKLPVLGVRWHHVRYTPLFNDDGEVCAVASSTRDVTDEIRKREKLEQERYFVRQVEEVMGAGVFVWDVETQRNLYCSDSLAHIHGMTPEEMDRTVDSEESDVELAIPADRPHLAQAYEHSRLYGTPLDVEYRIDHPEKGHRWLREVAVRRTLGDDNRIVTMGLVHDVTERKEREKELETQRVVAQQAEKVAKIGSWMWDLVNDRALYFSDQAAANHGYSREEFAKLQTSLDADLKRIHPDDHARVHAAMLKSRETQGTYNEEFRINHPDGKVHWINEIGMPYKFVDGQITEVIGVVQDITERRKKDEDLRQRDIIYRQIEDSISVGYWTWDEKNYGPIYVSKGIPKIYGLSAEEYMESLSSIDGEISHVHVNDRDRVREAAVRFQDTLEPYDLEYRIIHKDGSVRWVHEMSSPLQVSESGEMETSIGTLHDITARKVEEEDLRRREVMFSQIEDSFGIGLWTWDAQTGNMDYLSDSCCKIYGLNREEMLKRSFTGEAYLELIHPDDRPTTTERLNQFSESLRKPYEAEYRILHSDGGVRWVRSITAPLEFENDGSLLTGVGIVSDITDSKEREEELRLAKEGAENANLAKSDFLAHMSHELRTPLNAVLGFSDAIRTEIYGPLGDERYTEYLDNIQNSGRLLLSLINDLLDMSAIEAGELTVTFEPQNMAELVSEMVDLSGPSAQAKGITLTSSPDLAALDLMVDPRRFRQIILNLVINAVKFTMNGGEVAVLGRIDDQGRPVISVQDNGVGMTDEEKEAALIPFKQIKNATVRQIEGTGIGLPLTNRLVELHRGEMVIESEKGMGTTVVITLPVERLVQKGT